jgi:hypothetical protein
MQGQHEWLHLLTADELRPFHYVGTDCGIARDISSRLKSAMAHSLVTTRIVSTWRIRALH